MRAFPFRILGLDVNLRVRSKSKVNLRVRSKFKGLDQELWVQALFSFCRHCLNKSQTRLSSARN